MILLTRRRRLPEFVRAVYQAHFAHNRDIITDRAVISEVLQDLELPATVRYGNRVSAIMSEMRAGARWPVGSPRDRGAPLN